MDKTTIQISKELRDDLKAIGKKTETYEDLLRRLMNTNNNI